MKKKVIIILIVLTGILLFLYWNNRFVEFRQIKFNSEIYEISNESPSTQFNSNLKKVLKYYDQDFKEENGKIFIKNKIFRDKELMYNYTKKAKDSIWMSKSVE